MNYFPFHCSRIGSAHVKLGLPLQDCSTSGQFDNLYIAVVADGHGSRRHFRSDKGAEIACSIARVQIRKLLEKIGMVSRITDQQIEDLKLDICIFWRDAVLADLHENPWSETELNEAKEKLSPEQYDRLKDNSDALIPYGTTICAVFADPTGWIALQLGDGCFVHIDGNGEYTWPMPASKFNDGYKTASLCLKQPMEDFRHCRGNDQPAGLLVFTDGIEKAFPSQGKDIVLILHWIWNNARQRGPSGMPSLEKTLNTLTERSKIGDDCSIAGLVDRDTEDIPPKLTAAQKEKETQQIEARVSELKSTIEYNRKILVQLQGAGNDPDAIDRVRTVIERNKKELLLLDPDAADDSDESPFSISETVDTVLSEIDDANTAKINKVDETQSDVFPPDEKEQPLPSGKDDPDEILEPDKSDTGMVPDSEDTTKRKGNKKNNNSETINRILKLWPFLIGLLVIVCGELLIKGKIEKKKLVSMENTITAVGGQQTEMAFRDTQTAEEILQHETETVIALQLTENAVIMVQTSEAQQATGTWEKTALAETKAALEVTQTAIAAKETYVWQEQIKRMTEEAEVASEIIPTPTDTLQVSPMPADDLTSEDEMDIPETQNSREKESENPIGTNGRRNRYMIQDEE